MGRKLDRLLGRTFRVYKLKTFLGLAVARLAVLKNQRRARWSQSRGDVSELLKLGQQDRALLRVEHVIKEQNMLDVFAMIEGYCELVAERAVLIENQNDCPEELKEAISSLIFASSRFGELPELMEIRGLFTIRYGKEFTSAPVELRNNCGVNHKLIQKMSTKQPSLENKWAALKEIADEQGITLTIQEPSITNEIQTVVRGSNSSREPDVHKEQFSEQVEDRKYRDVASAALAAFESAALAAAAARAAVELSRYDQPQDSDSGDEFPRANTGKAKQVNRQVHPVDLSQEEKKEENNQFQEQSSRSESEEGSDDARAKVEVKQKPGKEAMVYSESDEESEEEQYDLVNKEPAYGLPAEIENDWTTREKKMNQIRTSRYDRTSQAESQREDSDEDNHAINLRHFQPEESDTFGLNLGRSPISMRTRKSNK